MNIDELREIGQGASQPKRTIGLNTFAVVGMCLASFVIIAWAGALFLGIGLSSLRAPMEDPIEAGLRVPQMVLTDLPSNAYEAAFNQCRDEQQYEREQLAADLGDEGLMIQGGIEFAHQRMGGRSTAHEKLIVCITDGPNERLCDGAFRKNFKSLIAEYIESGADGRKLLAVGVAMGDGEKVKMDDFSQTWNETPGMERIAGLFQQGYLQRDEFYHWFWGEPGWVKRMFPAEGSSQTAADYGNACVAT